jgi:hypothetical protein
MFQPGNGWRRKTKIIREKGLTFKRRRKNNNPGKRKKKLR